MKYEGVGFGYMLPLHPWDLILELTKYCEAAGFDAVYMADHIVAFGIKRFDALEAWTTLAALATITKKVKLGAIVSDVHRHHPAVLAQMVTTVDIISGGRAVLGIGIGEGMNLIPFGVHYDKPTARTREGVLLIKKLWTSEERISCDGEFFSLKSAKLQPKPVQNPHPPIWIAGTSPSMLKLVAEVGDGWVPAFMTPKEFAEKLNEIRAMAAELGRDASEITPVCYTYCVVAKSDEEAESLIKVPAKMNLAHFSTRLRRYGVEVPEEFKITKMPLDESSARKLLEFAKKLPDEVIEHRFIYGSPERCIEMIEEFIKAGVQQFCLPLLVRYENMKDTLKLFAEEVIKYFKEA
ncbi:MAG: Flavin-dependent oxidoreductase [Candidatus Alkanophagales archaeon MCA70_species_1]|nr:Flavin-dependent oxidoreductase [Candidatus Alkanophaga volatiphilum]